MFVIIFYYLVLPFLIFAVILRLLRKYSPDSAPKEILEFYAQDPIEPKFFRAIRLDGRFPTAVEAALPRRRSVGRFGHLPVVLNKLGDFEKQEDAVDSAFAAKSAAGETAESSFLVLNDKGEILQEV